MNVSRFSFPQNLEQAFQLCRQMCVITVSWLLKNACSKLGTVFICLILFIRMITTNTLSQPQRVFGEICEVFEGYQIFEGRSSL